jgi:hypothetical protein
MVNTLGVYIQKKIANRRNNKKEKGDINQNFLQQKKRKNWGGLTHIRENSNNNKKHQSKRKKKREREKPNPVTYPYRVGIINLKTLMHILFLGLKHHLNERLLPKRSHSSSRS